MEIKKEFVENEQPVAIFLACEYLHSDNKDDIDTTVTEQNLYVDVDFKYDNEEFQSEIFVKPSGKTPTKRKMKIPSSSEICFKVKG